MPRTCTFTHLDKKLWRLWQPLHIVAVSLQVFKHREDGGEDIEVGSSSHIALVRGEAEHCDGNLIVCLWVETIGKWIFRDAVVS